VFIEDEGEYWDDGSSTWEGVKEGEGVYDEGDGIYEDEEGVYEEEDGEGVYEEGEGVGIGYEKEGVVDEGVVDEGVVEDNVSGEVGVSGKKRVGYVSANNPSLHDNKIYCVVFHKTVHIIFFSFSAFIF